MPDNGKKKMGRPRVEIDAVKFEKLCYLQCTLKEIAGFFDCCQETIERWCKREYNQTFADTYAQKSQKGKISIRRKQMQVAESGNVALLIWLGKQYLDQSDKNEISTGENKPFVLNYKLD